MIIGSHGSDAGGFCNGDQEGDEKQISERNIVRNHSWAKHFKSNVRQFKTHTVLNNKLFLISERIKEWDSH